MSRVGEPIPIACTLTPSQARDRVDAFAALATSALVEHRRAPGHLELWFRDEPGVAAEVRALAAAEAECCSFLALAVEERDGHIVLGIDAPDGAEPVLDAFVEASTDDATARHTC